MFLGVDLIYKMWIFKLVQWVLSVLKLNRHMNHFGFIDHNFVSQWTGLKIEILQTK